MKLIELLPIPKGSEFQDWCSKWLVEMSTDLNSIIVDDPDAMAKRNERLAAYLGTLTTVKAIYRERARNARNKFYETQSRGSRTVKEFEEARDRDTAAYRYMRDLVDDLHSDILSRISVSQTNLRVSGKESGVSHVQS
jgi:hypothetical protein